MLDIIHSFVGCPSSDVHILSLPNEILLAYAFADCVVLLNARTFEFTRALAFWEVFPGIRDTGEHIRCISIEPGMRLIAAALGSSIALWSLSGVQKSTWRVHSSLSILDGQTITAIDCKSGLLGVGSDSGLSVYTLGLEDDLLTWTRKWFINAQACSIVRFSPSLMHIATIAPNGNTVRIYSTASGKQLQPLRHPRPVLDFIWRFSKKSRRDDLILYTITSDATLRIFFPVLDKPHILQLHASLDVCSDLPHLRNDMDVSKQSSIFWLHKDTLADSFNAILSTQPNSVETSGFKRLKEIADEGWDFFTRIFSDNSLVLRAVANIDRRPPTLLKQFTLLKSPSSTLSSYPRHLHILKTPRHNTLIIVTSPPLRTYEMDPLNFFEGKGEGMTLLASGPDFNESEVSKVLRFVRTPEGRGLAIVREDSIEAWHFHSQDMDIKRVGKFPKSSLVAVLDYGKRIALYTEFDDTSTLTLHQPVPYSSPISISVPLLTSLFCLPSSENPNRLIGISTSSSIIQIQVSPLGSSTLSMSILPESYLPSHKEIHFVTPIDPMAWNFMNKQEKDIKHDVLLSIADDGELSFWSLDEDDRHFSWRCTGKVRSKQAGYRMAKCSSAKKSALVLSSVGVDELTIWDSKESEFASGLEYKEEFREEPINDLDWTSTPDNQSILAVGFSRHVLLLCQQRMTYFNEEPAWGVLGRVDIGHMITHHITDSIWLANGTLLVAAGHHMLQYGQRAQKVEGADQPALSLFERVARLNGPLPDYHPQMILQCLLWGKIELVKEIIVNLSRKFKKAKSGGKCMSESWESVPIERYLIPEQSSMTNSTKPQYSLLFSEPNLLEDREKTDAFSKALVQNIIKQLEATALLDLTPNEQAHLIVLLQTTIEIDEQRRALDANGLRYLISMRSFFILNERASSSVSTPSSPAETPFQTEHRSTAIGRDRLRFRDMVWAFHSESKEILLDASTSACGGKMRWADAKALGVFLWLDTLESMKVQLETIARNEYMAGDSRDPTACSLFYFALGKVRLVHGLWKQAAWHKEQALMLKFLSNDFSQPRWRTAALKNAFALLSKQRFEYAAAFFLLGGGLKDAVNVCVRQLDDFQLAIALARVAEEGEEKPILNDLLKTVVIPVAFQKGNRWLASWAFWLMHRRDLAVRILVSPLEDVRKALDLQVKEVGDPNYDDPSLALLFSQLKSKSLQTAKGTNEISGQTEFNFVLQTARVFCRMGCHALALDLVKSWSFERPTNFVLPKDREDSLGTLRNSPSSSRPPLFTGSVHRRRSSIVIDMEVPSDPSTRPASPDTTLPAIPEDVNGNRRDEVVRRSGLGMLMKSAKQDVSVPEFDMNAFF